MTIQSVSYGKTVNLGNYETARIDVTVEASHDDLYNPETNERLSLAETQRRLFTAAKAIIAEEELVIRQNKGL